MSSRLSDSVSVEAFSVVVDPWARVGGSRSWDEWYIYGLVWML